MQNEASRSSQSRRKTVIVDEDDGEDELAKEPDEDSCKEDVAPKKRRGRPPKSTVKSQAKSAEKVLEDSEDDHDDASAPEEAPKKRGRGRPAKTATEPQTQGTGEPGLTKANEVPQRDQSPVRPSIEGEDALLKSEETSSNIDNRKRPIGAHPALPPERSSEKPAATPEKTTKASQTMHSPIKSSTKVAYRVGLSKRHRIPPLLRTMKPPKR